LNFTPQRRDTARPVANRGATAGASHGGRPAGPSICHALCCRFWRF